MFPLFEAHVDLADIEDELVYPVAKFGWQAKKRRMSLVTFPSIDGRDMSDSDIEINACDVDLRSD